MRKALVTQAALVLAISALAACAGDKGEINFVQPGYVKKSDLVGKSWYYRRTVVDSPETMSPYASVGTGDLFTIERVRFEWQEDYLVAYRDYEYIPNSQQQQGNEDGFEGNPVTFFDASHFDIARVYDPATGEQTNVLAENTTDREWYEREYARVNWSTIHMQDGEQDTFLLPVTWLEGGMREYFQDVAANAASPYRARQQADKGYVDFVTNHFVLPDPYVCFDTFDMSVYEVTSACASGEIKVRHAFWQVDEQQEATYEPLYYPDTVALTDENGREVVDEATGEIKREAIFDRFGFYRLEKLTYDDERGLTESGRLYRAIRFNIWEASKNADGSTIPESARQVRPIVYYMNWDFPADLKGAAREVEAEWNLAFKGTVASVQGKDIRDVPDVFILRDNDCNESNLDEYLRVNKLKQAVAETVGLPLNSNTLENWCAATEYLSQGLAKPFVWQQMGDPRFNMMYWVNNIIPSGWSGYGPMLGDPVSGRNVTSTAYIMGWTIESAATRATEYIDYINGEIDLTDLLAGSNVPNFFFNGDYDPRAQARDLSFVQENARHEISPEYRAELVNRFNNLGDEWHELMTPVDNSAHFAERLGRIVGTDLEKEYLVRPEDLILASRGRWRPEMNQEITEELWAKASYVGRMRDLRNKREATMRKMQERTMCPAAELDDALIGLAARLAPLTREERRQTLRKEIFKAVMLHEVGHNVGLRHNFEGSYDALNFIPAKSASSPGFWEIEARYRTDEAAKLAVSQPEYKYSSIMDYHGKVNGDFLGLGLYDKAAIKFGYGQLIETFIQPPAQGEGGRALKQYRFFNDYRDLEGYVGSVDRISPANRRDVKFDWTCKGDNLDYCRRDGDEGELLEAGVRNLTRNEVPYMFCSDEYANMTPTCKRFDFGANQREVQQAHYTKFKNYFIFTNFLRNRLVLDWDRALSRAELTFSDTLLTYQYMYLYNAKYAGFTADPSNELFSDMATAVADGLNAMSEALAMPRPDIYYRCFSNTDANDVTYYTAGYLDYDPITNPNTAIGPDDQTCDMSQLNQLALGQSYPLFIGFSEEYINYTLTYLGTYWDKMAALNWLTWPLATYFRENMQEDQRSFSVSFYRLYNQEVNDILLGLIEFDSKSLASNFNPTSGEVLPKQMVDPDAARANVKIVPALARNMQYYSLLYGMAFLTSPLDDSLDFAKHARVVVDGSADDFLGTIVQPGVNVARCTLPEGGLTYKAPSTTAATSRIDVAFNAVQKCSTEVTERELRADQLADAEDTLADLLNSGSGATPEEILEAEIARDDALDEFTFADDRLRLTEQTLQFMRSLNRVYEYGAGF